MLFNSIEFLFFFPIVTLLYFILPHKFRWLLLLIASCVFYAAFIPEYILILFATIIIDYFAGIQLGKNYSQSKKKSILLISLIANIGILAIFKYFNFFVDNYNQLFQFIGFNNFQRIPHWDLILPIGLSFHTFQAMSYTIEVYRGNQQPERHFGIYALYVMFYPQLVAGPIERPQNVLHQFHEHHFFNSTKFWNGIRLMLWGLFKKVVIADRLSIYVNQFYQNPDQSPALNLFMATLFFTIQIYCDFSGYSDMALGAAESMGFNLMINFKRPYQAGDIQEFWSRWHVSLSTWFRDYLYIPLGGNKKGEIRKYFNVAVVFILSGFWHGANWTFIVWGFLHAIGNSITMFWKSFKRPISIPILPQLATFSFVALAWIFFRADSLSNAWIILSKIGNINDYSFENLFPMVSGIQYGLKWHFLVFILIVFMYFLEKYTDERLYVFNKKPGFDLIFTILILTLSITLGVFNNSSFIYFQF
ncbi:MAG: MBOAT family protein [Bacteroidia bacterium]|nr:MBOAT family protein [Bacteroidia bacterium]